MNHGDILCVTPSLSRLEHADCCESGLPKNDPVDSGFMSQSIKILAFAGSARRESVNRRLLGAAAKLTDAEVTVVDLASYPMPLYDGDLEEADGMPDSAKKFKALMNEHQGILLACPEYNGSITPLLKNVIDWCSRPATEEELPLAAFRGKVAGLLGAFPGGLGGLRGLRHVREILGNIGVTVVPNQHALGGAYDAFDDSGALKDSPAAKAVQRVVDQLVKTTQALAAE